MDYLIREMKKEEYGLLEEFLYEAIYIPSELIPPPKSIINCPELQLYINDFGESKHDQALIAEMEGKVIGCAWARIMNDFGHIDDKVPSIAMSILKPYRGKGIGKSLLESLLIQEKKLGYAKVSLSVQKLNYALKMYEQIGFKIISENDEEYIMVITL